MQNLNKDTDHDLIGSGDRLKSGGRMMKATPKSRATAIPPPPTSQLSFNSMRKIPLEPSVNDSTPPPRL